MNTEEMKIKIFADGADVGSMLKAKEEGFVKGFTTNPTLMKRAGADSWETAKRMMKEIVKLLDPHPVSLELTELTREKMISQAGELASYGPNVVIKVPIGGYEALDPTMDRHTGLKVLHSLWEKDIKTNVI